MAINTTSVYEQQKYILQCLYVRPYSTNELRELGIYFPPARIKELRDKGFDIKTFYRKETDSSGLHLFINTRGINGKPITSRSKPSYCDV